MKFVSILIPHKDVQRLTIVYQIITGMSKNKGRVDKRN